MNYQIPKRKNNRVLKSDKAFINKSEPSNLLLQQMMDLQGMIEMDQGAPVVVNRIIVFAPKCILGTVLKLMMCMYGFVV